MAQVMEQVALQKAPAPEVGSAPGRSCPLHYRYRPEDFAIAAPEHLRSLDVLTIAQN